MDEGTTTDYDLLGLYFEERIIGGAAPNEYIPAVEEGFCQAARRGTHWPFWFVDIRCVLLDGKHQEVDSSYLAFQLMVNAWGTCWQLAGLVNLTTGLKHHHIRRLGAVGGSHGRDDSPRLTPTSETPAQPIRTDGAP